MAAVTQTNITVTNTGWTQLSAAEVQTLQLLKGIAGIIFAVSQPSSGIQVGELGHILSDRDFLNNAVGGTSWGRAIDGSTAIFGITEG